MWSQIQANKRNSIILMAIMAFVLIGLGYVFGIAFGGQNGGIFGIVIAFAVYIVLALISFSSGDQILLASSKAVPVTADVHPQLFNVVEEMTISAGLNKMPKIYIINEKAPNAFATGRNPESASVAVTAGLLARLNRDELQGVIAHEMSHIIHRDILYVTLAGIMLGTIVLLSQIFLRSMFYSAILGGGSRRYSSRSSSQGGGGAQIIMLVLAIAAAILAPLFAHILYFALSRRREYLADAGGARLTRYPEGLASALEKISSAHVVQKNANKVTAPMYFDMPFSGKKAMELFSTHPPAQKRIKILRNMGSGASFKDYEGAYSKVTGSKGFIPVKELDKESEPVAARQGQAGSSRGRKSEHIEAGDIMRKVNNFAFLTCGCGLKMKIPPNFGQNQLKCPKCGSLHKNPVNAS